MTPWHILAVALVLGLWLQHRQEIARIAAGRDGVEYQRGFAAGMRRAADIASAQGEGKTAAVIRAAVEERP